MWFTGNTTEGDAAEALQMADHLVEDFHVGAGGAVSGSRGLFANNTAWHEGTALSGSISTVLTGLSWICVGIHSRRALPYPVCA